MTKKKIGAIKIDFFNMRAEFSPNIKITSKKSQSITGGDDVEEVILKFEIESNDMDTPEYKAYSLSSDSVEDDEPFDLDNPWYKEKGEAISKEKPTKSPEPEPKEEPSETPVSKETQEKITQLETQVESLNKMIQRLDKNFQEGGISQEEYAKKKNYLGQKLGTLMGQLEGLKQ